MIKQSAIFSFIALACLMCVPLVVSNHNANAQQVSVLNSTNAITTPSKCTPCQPQLPLSATAVQSATTAVLPPAQANTTTTSAGREVTITIPPIHVVVPNQPVTNTTSSSSSPPQVKVIIVKVPTCSGSPTDPCGSQVPISPPPAPIFNNTTTTTTPLPPPPPQIPQVINSPPQEGRQPLVIHPDPFGNAGFCSDGHRGESFETSIGTPVTVCPNNGASFIIHDQQQSQSTSDNRHGPNNIDFPPPSNHHHHSNNGDSY